MASMVKIELGGGDKFARGDGWINVDQCDTADIIQDFNETRWDLEDDYADEIYTSHCIEHVHDPVHFLRECARIGKVGCPVEIRCPSPYSDLAMVAGHISVFSLQAARNMEVHFPAIHWHGYTKRLRFVSHRLQSSERLEEAKKELPFLRGLSDDLIMKYIPGTAHESVFNYVVQANEYAV